MDEKDGGRKKGGKLQKSYFDVLGLCCSSEVALIENILKNIDGVKDISVIVPSRTVIVVHDELLVSQLQIVKALNQARLEANVRNRGEKNFRNKWPSPYAVFCGILLVVSLFQFVFRPLKWVSLAAVAVGIFPIAWRSLVAAKNLTLDINILAIVAVIGTIILKDYLEAATIVFLFTIAEWLESRASHKATAVMSSLMNMAPQKAVIAETGEVVEVDDVKLGSIMAVKAGEVVPIDGIVVDGESEVDEKSLTGESFPVTKRKDSTVLAGTINLNGYISVKTTAIAEDCVVAKMAKLVEEAQNNKSKTQRIIDKCAKYYTPAVLLISVCVAVIPAAMRVHNTSQWYHLALVVLVSACPCGLILSTPVATFCALSKAATSGLLIKGGDYLETLAKIKTMAFDKTGTITKGEFVVSDFRSLQGDISLNTLIYWVSSVESKSSHPMATALVDYARFHSIEPRPDEVEEYNNYPGEGIHGKIDGKNIYIGNKRIAQRAHTEASTTEGSSMEGKTVGYIFLETTLAGMFSLSDSCRIGAAKAVNKLKSMGIRTVMLTGDSEASAMHAQKQLGNAIEVVHAELLPEDKARIIEEHKIAGRVAMIGDGINDAPALATADIGISMGISGSALATETGNVILMSNDIRKVPEAIELARRAKNKVIQNVALSIVTKGAILALAVAGHPLVWAAVLADVGTCLLVILNSMLLLRGTGHHGHNHDHHHGEKNHHHHHGGTCKSSAKDHSSHNGCAKGSCGSSKKTCEPRKICASQECATKCKSAVSKSSHCDKSCNDVPELKDCCADKVVKPRGNDCCIEPSVTHRNKDCCADSTVTHHSKTCCSEATVIDHPKNCCVEAVAIDHNEDCCAHTDVDHHDTDFCDETAAANHHHHEEIQPYETKCAPGKCLKPDTLEENECLDEHCHKPVEARIISIQDGEIQEVKHGHSHSHGSCSSKAYHTVSNTAHSHEDGLSKTSKCCEEKKATKADHYHNSGSCANKKEHVMCEAAHIHKHSYAKPSECCDEKKATKVGHCHTDQHSNSEHAHAHDKPVLSSCDVIHKKANCCGSKPDQKHTDIIPGISESAAAAHACNSLGKREIGGCCKSYRKECCSHKHSHFGKGLSEIVIE